MILRVVDLRSTPFSTEPPFQNLYREKFSWLIELFFPETQADREGPPSAVSHNNPVSRLFMPDFSRLFEILYFPEIPGQSYIGRRPRIVWIIFNVFSQDFLILS